MNEQVLANFRGGLMDAWRTTHPNRCALCWTHYPKRGEDHLICYQCHMDILNRVRRRMADAYRIRKAREWRFREQEVFTNAPSTIMVTLGSIEDSHRAFRKGEFRRRHRV